MAQPSSSATAMKSQMYLPSFSYSLVLFQKRHHVLQTAHPSPLSVYRGFFGCRHFSKTNELLQKSGKDPIDWKDLWPLTWDKRVSRQFSRSCFWSICQLQSWIEKVISLVILKYSVQGEKVLVNQSWARLHRSGSLIQLDTAKATLWPHVGLCKHGFGLEYVSKFLEERGGLIL